MSHLNLETLARLIDDAPDPTEAGHLDICPQCREDLESMRADVMALQRLPDAEPSVAQWIRLEQRLQREGLMRQQRWQWQPAALRMAAALVIFVVGGIAATLVMPRDTQYITSNQVPAQTVTAGRATIPNPEVTLAHTPPSAAAAPTIAALPPALRPARTTEEAADRLRAAESEYLTALTRFAELSGRAEEGDPVARLAALESIVATTRAALGRAPADPVINGYHLTAVAQRDALLRQVNASQQQTWY
jgi:hypothetical protein